MAIELTKHVAQQFHELMTLREKRLVIWVITHGTKDYGDRYTARPIVMPNTRALFEHGHLIADSLDEIRSLLPNRLTKLARHPNDDPVIVESWGGAPKSLQHVLRMLV